MEILRKFHFWHISLILSIFVASITYFQGSDGFSRESATLFVFIWTLIATWISVEFYKGDLKEQNEKLKGNIEDWKATVFDYRNEAEELKQENEELRESIKELTVKSKSSVSSEEKE